MMVDAVVVEVEFGQWLQRLVSTYDAITYTCRYRVGDRELAREVGFRVLAGMIGSPQVFAHHGLPYSGRIGRLAEPLIAEARQGHLAVGPADQWPGVLHQLRQMPTDVRDVAVATWVLGHKGDALGAFLGCDRETAERRRQHALGWVRALLPTAARLTPTAPGPTALTPTIDARANL